MIRKSMVEFPGSWYIKAGEFLSGGASCIKKRGVMKFGCTANILSAYSNFSFTFLYLDPYAH